MSHDLTGDEILAADDTKIEAVDMTEFGWKGIVYVRNLTGETLDSYLESLVVRDGDDVKSDTTLRHVKLLVRAICDKDGKRIFKDIQIADLSKKNGAAILKLFDVADGLNAISGSARSEVQKNSEATSG